MGDDDDGQEFVFPADPGPEWRLVCDAPGLHDGPTELARLRRAREASCKDAEESGE
jgi:hypothetical protein